MTTLPHWAQEDWTQSVADPFRTDREFWASVAASADALVCLVAAVAVSIVLVAEGQAMWSWAPYLPPAGLAVRAGLAARASSRRSRSVFADQQSWRGAERAAVAQVFGRVLRRSRVTPH